MAYGLTEQSVNGHFRDWMEKGQSDATTAFWGRPLIPDENSAQGWV